MVLLSWAPPQLRTTESQFCFRIELRCIWAGQWGVTGPAGRGALEGKGPWRRPQKPLDKRLEEVAKAVGGGYCRLQMPLSLALSVRETVARHRVGALEGAGYPTLSSASLPAGPKSHQKLESLVEFGSSLLRVWATLFGILRV